MLELPLGVNYDGPNTIQISSTTYAPKNCHVYMSGEGQMGHFDELFGAPMPEPAWIAEVPELCDFPGVTLTTPGKKVSGYEINMNVADVYQFWGKKMLEIECETEDVTLYSQLADLKCGSETQTVQTMKLKPCDLYFWDYYWNDIEQYMNIALVYVSQLSLIGLQGGNYILDAALDNMNLMAWEQIGYYYMQSLGVDPWDMDYESKGAMVAEAFMGQAMTYSAQNVIDAYYIWMNRDNLFTWNTSNWGMYQLIMGNLSYNNDFWMMKKFYFDLHVFISEILAIVGFAHYDPWYIIQQGPRLGLASWRLALDFLA
jgi:hypothetical protein